MKQGKCMWFLRCANKATSVEPHPILNEVPICASCQAKLRNLESKVVKPDDAKVTTS